MYTTTRYNYPYRSSTRPVAPPVHPLDHKRRVREELKHLGVSWFGLATMESEYLPSLIHADEHIGGVVYGKHPDGFAMLVATDRRVIFLDLKPLFQNEDEITFDVVSGVSFGHAGLGSTVTLHTRVKDYPIRTYNQTCARNFVQYIELRCLEHKNQRENSYD
jgi:hypothetical protein